MTYNIGGTKSPNYSFSNVLRVIRNLSPDFLCIQEIFEKRINSKKIESQVKKITETLGKETRYYFGPTISTNEHFHPSKQLFVDLLFEDIQEWVQGNAFFSKKIFTKLGNQLAAGKPRNLPVFTPITYEGNRNTDPRRVIISRIKLPNLSPFVIGTHLTTLVGEDDGNYNITPSIKEVAQKMRLDQTQKIIQIIKKHILDQHQMAILLGDFNAPEKETCIVNNVEGDGRFVRLAPENQGHRHIVDHIFIFPGDHYVEYSCKIMDDAIAKKASDHFPIYADVTIHTRNSKKYLQNGAGVFAR